MKSIRNNFLKPFLFVCFGLMIAAIAIARNPYDEPSQPGPPKVISSDATSCVLRWTTPVRDGGSPIIKYIIECREKNTHVWVKAYEVFAPYLTCIIAESYGGREFEFRIIAVNAAGPSEPSEPSDIIVF